MQQPTAQRHLSPGIIGPLTIRKGGALQGDKTPFSRHGPLAEKPKTTFPNPQAKWMSLHPEELVRVANRAVVDLKLTCSHQLKKARGGIHNALWKRGLLGQVEYPQHDVPGEWRGLDHDELVAKSKHLKRKRGITEAKKFQRAYPAHYMALWRRKLLDRMGFKETRAKPCRFAHMDDFTYVTRAVDYIKKEKFASPHKFQLVNEPLYNEMLRRHVRTTVYSMAGLAQLYPSYKKMDDNALLERAEEVRKAGGTTKRKFQRLAGRLYKELKDRGLHEELELEEAVA